MKKQALSSPKHSVSGRGKGRRRIPCGQLSFGLTGLLLLGGCNKTPAPAAPAAEPSTTAQTAPPPAALRQLRCRPRLRPLRRWTPAPPPPAGPAVPPPPPPPRQYTVPAGTPLVVRIGQTISAKNSNVGDSFTEPWRSPWWSRSECHPGRRAGDGNGSCRKGPGTVQGQWGFGGRNQKSGRLRGHDCFL